MKKIIALLFILIITPFFIVSDMSLSSEVRTISKNNIKNPETSSWEYLKHTIFDNETSVYKRLEGPISIKILQASASDSLLIEEIFMELRQLLPDKEIIYGEGTIASQLSPFLKNHRKKDLDSIQTIFKSRIDIVFESSGLHKNSEGPFIQLMFRNSIQSNLSKRKGGEFSF